MAQITKSKATSSHSSALPRGMRTLKRRAGDVGQHREHEDGDAAAQAWRCKGCMAVAMSWCSLHCKSPSDGTFLTPGCRHDGLDGRQWSHMTLHCMTVLCHPWTTVPSMDWYLVAATVESCLHGCSVHAIASADLAAKSRRVLSHPVDPRARCGGFSHSQSSPAHTYRHHSPGAANITDFFMV